MTKPIEGTGFSRMQPLFIIIVVGILVLFISAVHEASLPTAQVIAETEALVEQEWEQIQEENPPPQPEPEPEPLPEPEPEPEYSGTVELYLLDTVFEQKSVDYTVVSGLSLRVVNDIGFEKHLSIQFYLYDDNDESEIKNKPIATFDVPTLGPGEEVIVTPTVHAGFNEISTEKTLKFRIKDELSVILDDFVFTKVFPHDEKVLDTAESSVDTPFEIIPLEFGFVQKGDNWGVIENMTLLVRNDADYHEDITVSIFLYDENDETLVRNQVHRKLQFPILEPHKEYTRAFPVHISFNELNIAKTVRFKVVNPSKVVIADIEYKKAFLDEFTT